MGRNAQRRKELKMNNNGKEGLKDLVAGPQPPAVVITITMSTRGEININGPLHDKVLCYGLLGIAHDLVRDFKPQQLVVPQLIIPSNLKG